MRKENGKIRKSRVLENVIIALVPTVKLVGAGFAVYYTAF